VVDIFEKSFVDCFECFRFNLHNFMFSECVCVYNVDTSDFFFRMYVEGEVMDITFIEIQYFFFVSVCVCFQTFPLPLPQK